MGTPVHRGTLNARKMFILVFLRGHKKGSLKKDTCAHKLGVKTWVLLPNSKEKSTSQDRGRTDIGHKGHALSATVPI